jgi:hypothetical protein
MKPSRADRHEPDRRGEGQQTGLGQLEEIPGPVGQPTLLGQLEEAVTDAERPNLFPTLG